METLQNEHLTIEVSSLGAELQSIRDAEGREYLWQADKQYWPRHSPIPFPIVCGLWEKNAPFVCIEPWYGLHDGVDYQGKFKDKSLMNHLQPSASFMSEYTIEVGVSPTDKDVN